MNLAIRGLYVITREDPGDTLLDDMRLALRGGATVIQYRNKRGDEALRLEQATRLRRLCRRHGVPFIVNDDIELARASGADGVHLGRGDGTVAGARAALGSGAVIGVSCYDSLARARAAAEEGADYVAFGSFFPSPTKPRAVAATPGLLQQAVNTLNIPVVAIGGITPENGALLVRAGAHALAVISGLYADDGIEQAARRYAGLFETLTDRNKTNINHS